MKNPAAAIRPGAICQSVPARAHHRTARAKGGGGAGTPQPPLITLQLRSFLMSARWRHSQDNQLRSTGQQPIRTARLTSQMHPSRLTVSGILLRGANGSESQPLDQTEREPKSG